MSIVKRIVHCLSVAAMVMACIADAEVGTADEFWIGTNATGNFYSSGAKGTQVQPLDGSSPANFDANMNSLPANSTIHLLPGTFQTRGYWGGFSLKTGQKLLGSGRDVTVIQFMPGLFVGHSGAVMISDMVENNYIEGAASGLHNESIDGITNLTVAHNVFKNCDAVCDFDSAGSRNITFASNHIVVSNACFSGQAMGFVFWAQNGASYTNIQILGNKVNDSATRTSRENDFVRAGNVTGLLIADNVVDARLTNSLSGCSNVREHNNRDLHENFRSNLNEEGGGALSARRPQGGRGSQSD